MKYAHIILFLLLPVLDAQAIYRCEVKGQTIFQDSACIGSLGTHAKDFNRRAKRQELENEQILQNSLRETTMRPEERTQRASNSEKQARAAVVEFMIDPNSSELRKIKTYAGIRIQKIYPSDASISLTDLVCGEVNSKNRMGGYVGFKPFFWTSHDKKLVMADPIILTAMMNDMIIRTCADVAK